MYQSSTQQQRWSDTQYLSLSGTVTLITGSSRGIGLFCAKKLAKHSSCVVILSKTTKIHPKLPGTIYTAKKQIEQIYFNSGTNTKKDQPKVIAIPCDIRKQVDVQNAVSIVKKQFGKIDILVNNASAIDLSPSAKISTKKFDLMNEVNTRGSFLVTQKFLPLLKKSESPYIINITPPLSMISEYPMGKKGLPYIISKLGMSYIVLGTSKEYPEITSIGLWPKKTVATAAVKNVVGTTEEMNRARSCWIVADALYLLLMKKEKKDLSGKFFYDEQIVQKLGGLDLDRYLMKGSELKSFHAMFERPEKNEGSQVEVKPKL